MCVTGIVSMIIDAAVMGKSLTHVGVRAPCWREREAVLGRQGQWDVSAML